MTNWFVCSDHGNLEKIAARLSPGSVVSLYFDNRIKRAIYSASVRKEIEEIIDKTGDCVIGKVDKDGLALCVDFIAGPTELEEFEENLEMPAEIYYGAFPARDNDGDLAITVVLPYKDGVVRPHPH